MSRTQARKEVRGDQLQKEMEKRGIYVRTASYSGLAEEAGFAYKPISEVVDTMDKAGISKKIVAFKPIGNVKGTVNAALFWFVLSLIFLIAALLV